MRRPCVHVRRSTACRYKRRSISLLSTSVIQKSTFSTQPPSTSLIAFVAIERPCSCRADARTQKPENNHDGPCTTTTTTTTSTTSRARAEWSICPVDCRRRLRVRPIRAVVENAHTGKWRPRKNVGSTRLTCSSSNLPVDKMPPKVVIL